MDFCWDPWQVSVLALPQSCQPREWMGSPCLSLPGPWLPPKAEWVATVVCRGQRDNVLWLTALPSYPFLFYRGASKPPMATYPTLEPAPATTVWPPWPPHPLWVGPHSPPPALPRRVLRGGNGSQSLLG